MLLPSTYYLRISRLPRLASLLIASLLASHAPRSQAQQLVFDWAAVVSDTGYGGESWLGDVAQDAQGNVYVGGYFAGSLYCGGQHLTSSPSSGFNGFVAKYDADGTLLWVRQAGPGGGERIRALTADAAGNVYIAGSYRGPTQFGPFTLTQSAGAINDDLFVAKLDAAGNWQWAVGAVGSGDDFAMALALAPGGQLAVGGWFNSATLSLGAGQTLVNQGAAGTSDVFVARLSTAGSWLSAVPAGGTGSEQLTALAVDAAGTTYACGSLGGQPALFGTISLLPTGNVDGFVARLTPGGAWQWATRLGSLGGGGLRDLALDGSGRPYVTGAFWGPSLTAGSTTLTNAAAGTSDILVAALATDGSWRWAARAGDVGIDAGVSLGITPAGQVRVAGQFYSRRLTLAASELLNTCDAGQSELFVGQLDDNGNWLSGLATTGPGGKENCHLVVGPTGDTYLASPYWGTKPMLGGTTLPSAADYLPNIFVAHVADATTLAQVMSLAPTSGTVGQPISLTGSGFVDVRSVRFNGVAAAFQVESATRLTAIVPAGATAGPIRVRTGAGTSASPVFFMPAPLASRAAEPATDVQLWPNPVATAAPVEVRLPTTRPLGGPTRVEVRNSVGQLVAHTQFTGYHLAWAPRLPAGLYQLTLCPTGQPAWQQRIAVSD